MIPNETNTYKYRRLEKYEDKAIKDVINYINRYDGKLYIISRNAYIFKLEANIPITIPKKKNIPINKYDLLNNGNFGTGGYQQIINEIEDTCSNEKCVFFVDERELTKDPDGIYNKNILILFFTLFYIV